MPTQPPSPRRHVPLPRPTVARHARRRRAGFGASSRGVDEPLALPRYRALSPVPRCGLELALERMARFPPKEGLLRFQRHGGDSLVFMPICPALVLLFLVRRRSGKKPRRLFLICDEPGKCFFPRVSAKASFFFLPRVTTNRVELLHHCNQLRATRGRVQSYRMKLGDSSLESPVSRLSLSVSTAS